MMRNPRSLVAALLIAALGTTVHGMFMNRSVKVPVDRAVANVEKWIKEKPRDAQAYYVLGRLHALAWAYGPDLNLWRPMPEEGARPRGRENQRIALGADEPAPGADPFNGGLPGFGPYDAVQVRRAEDRKEVTPADATHLRDAIRNYRKAVELNPNSAIYHLGLAWLLQETGKAARSLPPAAIDLPEAKPTDAEKSAYAAAIAKLGDGDIQVRDQASEQLAQAMPKPFEQLHALKSTDAEVNARVERLLTSYYDLQALEHYRKAYALSIDADMAKPGGMMMANAVISAEAGESILQILTTHPKASKPDEEKQLGAALKALAEKPRAITPIIFRLPGEGDPGAQKLSDLLDPLARTTFDLAGDDVLREWPWVRPGTSFLVWDPLQTGQISSGRALFGSATWWIAFRDGYEALSILDDNRDGCLAGDELQGISVWTDQNANGVSEPGEVKTAAGAGITVIDSRASRDADDTLTVPAGISFSDGSAVPSFDWVTLPAAKVTRGK